MIIQKGSNNLADNSIMKRLAKWLLIIIAVLIAFITMLLGLGYLLNENEKSATILKTQLEQEYHAEQLKQARREKQKNTKEAPIEIMITDEIKTSITSALNQEPNKKLDTQVIEKFQQTVINNLTCITTQQCQVVQVKFNKISCPIAINSIGASQLKKIPTATIDMPTCSTVKEQAVISCQQNICTF